MSASARTQCVLLVILGFAVRAVGLGFGLPHANARPDEETIVSNALRLERENTWDPAFFSYPSLMIYGAYGAFWTMHAGMRLAGTTQAATLNELFLESPAAFHWAVRCIGLVCGALTPVAVYAAARRLWGRQTAWLVGLILALCYLHVRDSHFGVTDVPFVFLACVSFWQLARFHTDRRIGPLAVASIVAVLAMGTKYTGVWLGLPFGVAIGFAARGARRPRRNPMPPALAFPIRGRTAARLAGHSCLAILLTLVGFFAASPYFFLDFRLAREHLGFEMHLVRDEAPIAAEINGYLDHFRTSLWYGLGWPVLLGALGAGVAMAIRRDARGLLVWSLPVGFYLYAGASNRVFIRYMDVLLPFLAMACAWGVRSLALWSLNRRRGLARLDNQRLMAGATRFFARPIARLRLFSTLVVMLMLLPSIRRIYQFDVRMTRTDTRLLLHEWLVENLPADEPILWSGGWSAMPYMIHQQHPPVRILHGTEKLQRVFVENPDYIYNYRWIILVEWPRAYYRMGRNEDERAYLQWRMEGRYELVHEIDAYKADLPPELFSPLDHFYMSFAEPGIIERPGPGFRVYRRK